MSEKEHPAQAEIRVLIRWTLASLIVGVIWAGAHFLLGAQWSAPVLAVMSVHLWVTRKG